MVAHGSARTTLDMDMCYRRSKDNIERLSRAVQPLRPRLRGAPADLPFRFDPRTIQAGLNFTLATDLGDLDFLGEVSGIGFYEAVLDTSEIKEVSGLQCRILSLSGLIRAKRAAGRNQDLNAIQELEALQDLKKRTGL